MRMRFFDVFFLAICFLLFCIFSKNYSQISNITDAGFDTTLLSVNWAAETPKVGHISKLRLVKIDLTNFDDLVTFCNVTDNMKNGNRLFKKCWGKLKEVRIFTSPKQEDMNRWTMRQNLPFFDKSSKFYKRKNDSFQFIIDSRGGVPELSKPYAPHLVAIEGAYVSKWGYIFDSKRLYNFGGCANKGWDEPNLEIDLWKFKVLTFDEPILSLVHPYSRAYFHEMIETYATLFIVKPILEAIPNLPILVKMSSRFQLTSDFTIQLLTALDIKPAYLNIQPLGPQVFAADVNFVTKFLIRNFFKDNNAVARAPYVITPLSLYCQYISRGTLRDMRETLAASVPHLWSAGEQSSAKEKKLILLYHNSHHWQLKFEESRMDSRKKQDDGHRRRRRKAGRFAPTIAAVEDGERLLFHSLAARYHTAQSGWEVREVHGNESFAQTVRSFRAARFFIATHGPAMSNILFLREGAAVIEIRPVEWPNSCYTDICNALDVDYYDVRTTNGVDVMDAAGSSSFFLNRLFFLIDSHRE